MLPDRGGIIDVPKERSDYLSHRGNHRYEKANQWTYNEPICLDRKQAKIRWSTSPLMQLL